MAEHHRDGEDSTIINSAKSATSGLNFLKNWVGVVALLVWVGWEAERIVGKIDSAETASENRFRAIEKSVDDFKIEIRQKIKDTGSDATSANKDIGKLEIKVANVEKDLSDAKHEISENYKIMMTYQAKPK